MTKSGEQTLLVVFGASVSDKFDNDPIFPLVLFGNIASIRSDSFISRFCLLLASVPSLAD